MNFFPLLPLILRPPLPLSLGSLDAEQTQCTLCKITRLIKANKQTTALRQLQMKANLYTINKRRSSFNLPVRPAHCSPPPFLSTSILLHLLLLHLLLPPTRVLPISVLAVLLGWAQRQGKLTDASIIHRSPLLSLSLCLFFSGFLCRALCVFRVRVKSLQRGEFGDEKMCVLV